MYRIMHSWRSCSFAIAAAMSDFSVSTDIDSVGEGRESHVPKLVQIVSVLIPYANVPPAAAIHDTNLLTDRILEQEPTALGLRLCEAFFQECGADSDD